METGLIKPIIKVGNSAGVILPREWLNGQARIELIKKPLNIKSEIFEILSDYLNEIKGIYLVGSYARDEETLESDVDVLSITEKTNSKIESGKYNIILITEEELKDSLANNIFPVLPMLKEAKTVLNGNLIESYKDTPLTKKNLSFHIETTKTALNVNKEAIKLSEMEKENISDNFMYSLVLRLRGVYLVDCLINGKIATTKGLISIIKHLTGSLISYDSYIRSKNDKRSQRIVNINDAKAIYSYVLKKITEQEKWIKRKEKRR
jgi:predicted nucleotidyltransferase